MNLEIKREILLNNLKKVSKALKSKNLVPILSGIKIDLEDKGLTLTASDNDITIETLIPNTKEIMTIKELGSIIVTGKLFLDIISNLDDEFIKLEVRDESKVFINSTSGSFELNGINKKEYPNINLVEKEDPIILNSNLFRDLVNQTSFATSTDESRPQLTGINIRINGNELECNATDSYRLARKVLTLETMILDPINIVIPSKNIVEFSSIIESDNIELHIFSNKILFKSDNLLFQSRLINGSYPNVANLIPKEYLLTINVNKQEFLRILQRVSILTSDREKNIVTLETTESKELILKSSSQEIGKAEQSMLIEKDNENGDIRIAFSARYMLDALKAIDEEFITIRFVGEVNPIVIREKSETLTQLVLPIRTY